MKRFALAGLPKTSVPNSSRLLARAGTTLDEPWALNEGERAAQISSSSIPSSSPAAWRACARSTSARTSPSSSMPTPRHPKPGSCCAVRCRRSRWSRCSTAPAAATSPPWRRGHPRAMTRNSRPDVAEHRRRPRASFETPRAPRNAPISLADAARCAGHRARRACRRLFIDPAAGNYHANAPLSRLEPYFLDPLKPAEYRQLPSSRLEEMRAQRAGASARASALDERAVALERMSRRASGSGRHLSACSAGSASTANIASSTASRR